jgi:beta-N-acetylhexosaminidase
LRVRVEAVGESTSLADRKRRAGQRLLLGFRGTAVDGDLRRIAAELRPAGFFATKGNGGESAEVRELTAELRSLIDPTTPALIAVDQEGGRVQAVRDPTRWPAMRIVGRAADEDPGLPERIGRAIGAELRHVGFDLDLAPVADVDSNPANPVIGDRSLGSDPQRVARAVAGLIRGLQSTGVMACAKHFPGHGDTATDSHRELPIVERPRPELERTELPPFRAAIEAGVATIMTAHVLFPEWDENLPATLSPRVVPRVLRKELGYNGVVLSDDLEMRALQRWSLAEQVRGVTDATVDLVLVGDPLLQPAIWEELVRQQEEDPAFERAVIASVGRVRALRERFLVDRAPAPRFDPMEHRVLVELVEARGR